MGHRSHADQFITRRLWEQVYFIVVDNWEDLEPLQQTQARERVMKLWRSLRDRFKKEFNKEMQAPSGSGERRSQYKYGRVLFFLRSMMVSRSTICSTREPATALDPSGAIPQESATGDHVDRPHPSDPLSDPSLTAGSSASSTSIGASCQTLSHEAAGEELAFHLPHPSDAATCRTPVGYGRQRQRGQERSYAPKFLHLNAAFQNSIKLLAEQMTAEFNMLNKCILELSSRFDRMHLDASRSPNIFFQAVLTRMENLTPDQQMHVMQGCHADIARATSKAPPPPPVVAPTPPSSHCPSYQSFPVPKSFPVHKPLPFPKSVPVPNAFPTVSFPVTYSFPGPAYCAL
ncbi:uncharacterized protein LOC143803992 [Ranitomeya variabilis]|uniref:uncharacterized protein LOC143803992 n=1 Tax=Ranitomeya variabilis TaxID=490064 RepID=UPI004056333D